jgi:hypothetical protein
MYGCVYCVFCRYANHICVSLSVRTDYGDECDCHRLYVCLIYWAKFSVGEEHIGSTYCMICICMCMNELNLVKQTKKLEVNSSKKTVIHNATQFQLAVISLFKIEILSFTNRQGGYKIL